MLVSSQSGGCGGVACGDCVCNCTGSSGNSDDSSSSGMSLDTTSLTTLLNNLLMNLGGLLSGQTDLGTLVNGLLTGLSGNGMTSGVLWWDVDHTLHSLERTYQLTWWQTEPTKTQQSWQRPLLEPWANFSLYFFVICKVCSKTTHNINISQISSTL